MNNNPNVFFDLYTIKHSIPKAWFKILDNGCKLTKLKSSQTTTEIIRKVDKMQIYKLLTKNKFEKPTMICIWKLTKN